MAKKIQVEWKDCAFDESSLEKLQGISGVCLIYEKDMETEMERAHIIDRGDLTERIKEHLDNEEFFSSLPQGLWIKYAKVPKELQYGAGLFLMWEYGIDADQIEVYPPPFPFNPEDYKVYGVR